MAAIRKRGTKWQAQIRRHGHRPLTKTFLTKEDALRWTRSHERRIDLGEAAPPNQVQSKLITLADLITRYEAEVSPTKRSKSDGFHFRQMLRHPIAKLAVTGLTATAIAGYRDHRLVSVTGATVRKELTLLGHVLKIARNEWGVPLIGDPAKTVRKPAATRGRDRRLSPEEFAAIEQALQQMRNPLIKQAFLFALATGMRRGEVLSLDWRNVDLKNRTATLPMTKNGEKRTVPLSPTALDVLNQRATRAKEEDKASSLTEADTVFPVTPNALRMAWDRMKNRINIKDLRFHDLRHEAISRFFEMGLSMPEVALISGHKDARMLFRYTHLRPEGVAQKLDALSGKIE